MRFIQHSEKEINSEQGEYALMSPCFSVSRLLALPLRGPLLRVPSALHLVSGWGMMAGLPASAITWPGQASTWRPYIKCLNTLSYTLSQQTVIQNVSYLLPLLMDLPNNAECQI